MLTLSPTAGAVGEAPGCTFSRGELGVALQWQPIAGWPVVRRDGAWLASPDLGATSYLDTQAPAQASYSVRYWNDAEVSVDIDCVEADAGAGGPTCSAVRDGSVVTIRWDVQAGSNVVRRDGRWLATPPAGAASFTDTAAPPGADYAIRVWTTAGSTDIACDLTGDQVATCTLEWIGADAVLSWNDLGGRHVVRLDGEWVATPGAGSSQATISRASRNGVYDIRTWYSGGAFEDRVCTSIDTQRVIHISIDGLRSDHVTAALTPNLVALIGEGASTLNARTDYDVTKTLPNHASQLTGRYVLEPWGHQVADNQDLGMTVHEEAGFYVSSVFDVVHDNGGLTAMYAGKDKFDVIERSYNAFNGAVDRIGANDGRNKIDVYDRNDPAALVAPMLDLVAASPSTEFVFFHIRYPDSAGHASGWATPAYREAVRDADALVGQIIDGLDAAGLASSTNIIVTSDHGGPDNGLFHDDPTDIDTYTVPFIVWGPAVRPGADLYDLNRDHRVDPGTARPDHLGAQPIRTTEVANLVTSLLDLPPVPGSVVGRVVSLQVG
ncbi:MAG: alkaline phosphatase family protein [Acidimicrobiales bacterium]|nr:alkaline phosphatase family protein [Acidimicrobiales bacterium]